MNRERKRPGRGLGFIRSFSKFTTDLSLRGDTWRRGLDRVYLDLYLFGSFRHKPWNKRALKTEMEVTMASRFSYMNLSQLTHFYQLSVCTGWRALSQSIKYIIPTKLPPCGVLLKCPTDLCQKMNFHMPTVSTMHAHPQRNFSYK